MAKGPQLGDAVPIVINDAMKKGPAVLAGLRCGKTSAARWICAARR